MRNISNKQFWMRNGQVDYICIDTRPARSSDVSRSLRCEVDFVPPPDFGAYEAIRSLQDALLRHSNDPASFYELLKEFCDGH